MSQEEEFEKTESPEESIDFSDWELATTKDLDILKVPLEPERVQVPLDFKTKKYINLYIRELTIDEQLRLLEEFFTFDSKTNEAKFKWLPYYRTLYLKMVKKTEPRIEWKEARFYGKKFLAILFRFLPHPFEIALEGPGGISELEEKNYEQP